MAAETSSAGPPGAEDAAVLTAGARPPVWQPVLFTSMAGAMGWGIRGQYGHETGAMLAGLLVSLVLVFLLWPHAGPGAAARAVAFGTLAMGIGGSMTYGQTIGLTQNPEFIRNWEAWRWGMLGLGIKGAIWIGFAGLFIGMGMGGVRYTSRDMLLALAGTFALYHAGCWALNEPFDPANRILPPVYFSASWHWLPGAGAELKPRREVWGGLLFALAGLWAWSGWLHRDRLARHLALWGLLGGVGFPAGQCLQSFHAWNPEAFRQGIWVTLAPVMNWWNWMETTFGAVMGAFLGFGLWLNRRRISQPASCAMETSLRSGLEWLLVCVHLTLLVLSEFTDLRWASLLYDPGIILVAIPLVAVAGGRFWPFLVIFPITLVPIAGKTLRALVYQTSTAAPALGWLVYGVLPLAASTVVCVWLFRLGGRCQGSRWFCRRALLINAWIYFGLNYAWFRFPWPWETWTIRTPNAILFTICLLGITLGCLLIGRRRPGLAAD